MYCDPTDRAQALHCLHTALTQDPPPTAARLRELAQAAQMPPAATDLLVAATAVQRHQHRVQAARQAALAWGLGARAEPAEAARRQSIVEQALAACVADMVGIGGGVGCDWGAATTRHPAFQQCGTGRKQAGDGGAWSAAILEVAHGLQAELRELRLAAGVAPELDATLDAGDFLGGYSPLWDASVAGLAMLLCLGVGTAAQRDLVRPWLDLDPEDAGPWAAALQEAREEIEKAKWPH